jgi:undecaprenyl-diphosphatase
MRRGWPEAAAAIGALLLALAALPIDADRVSDAETAVFRAINGPTVLPFLLVWPFMQLGNVHIGAHLPLDVVGGAGLCLAVAGLVLLVAGRPA